MPKPILPPELAAELAPATLLVRGGSERSAYEETSEALFLTSGFVYGSAAEAEAAFKQDGSRYVYSRYRNPTVTMFEERLRLIEGAEACRATASGMAAVFAALLCKVRAGQRVVASRALFGSCYYIVAELLPRYGVETVIVDGRDLSAWEEALAPGAAVSFCESPSNPAMEIIDLAEVARLTHRAGGILVVDNVFATPLLQKPLALGADVVVYSATKHIDGQGRALGGAILASEKYIKDDLGLFYRHTGPSLSPFNAWLLLKGLETLELRVERQCRTALAIARFLETHPKIARVIYPGLPSHPQYELARRQMKEGGTRRRVRHRRRQGRLLPLSRRAEAGRHLEQSRRLEEPRDASGDDDAFAPQTRGARRARHRRRAGPPVGRARSRSRSAYRSVPGAGSGLAGCRIHVRV